MNQVAKTYAEALFMLASDMDKVKEFKSDIKLVELSLNGVEGIKKYLVSANITKTDKKKIFTESFNGKISKEVLNFLYVLVERGRVSAYNDVFHEFYHFCNNYLGIKEGVVESARPLSEEKVKELERALSKDGVQVELDTKINTTLISGFKIIFDDKIIDTSMKKKITQMNEMLLRKDVSLWN